ncbi:MAG: hypothetical protein ACODAC_06500 [Pseudomonadota bacterium]
MRLRFVALALGVTLAAAAGSLEAEPPHPASGFTLYSAQGIDTTLPDFPQEVAGGALEWDKSYFTGVGYTFGTPTPGILDRAFRALRAYGASTGVELIEVKHRGLQSHLESTVAYRINSPYWYMGPVASRFGYSLGLSYGHDLPRYERAPDGDRERLLTYMAYELEFRLRDIDRVSLVTRLHHRSGAYGLLAPRGAGSNFLAFGVRMHW